MRRAHLTAVACAAAAALAVAAPPAGAAKTLRASSGPLKVTLVPPGTHTPKANRNIWVRVTATLRGRPASGATALYQFLFAGQVVSTQYVRNNRHFTFRGSFRDNLVFPASAVGQPLTLRIIVRAGGRSVHFDWKITTRR